MPTIPLTNALGLDATGMLQPGSMLTQILPSFLHFQETPIDQVALTQAAAHLTFSRPIQASAGGLSFNVGASGGGTLSLEGSSRGVLDPSDPFSAIPILANEIYLGLGLDFSFTAGVSATVDSFSFGFSAERDFGITCFRRFQSDDHSFPAFGKAFAATADSFLLPLQAADLSKVQSDTVLVINGTGILTFSAGVTVETPVAQLAATSPLVGQQVKVSGSGSFSATATLTLTGGYQIRLRRLAATTVEVGVYKIKSRELAIEVTATAGISPAIGNFDLAENFIRAISRQPEVDLQEFRQALPGEDQTSRDEQIQSFQDTLHGAISTKVQASVTDTLSHLQSNEAAWLFEIDLQAATSNAAVSAISSALKGDFTLLTHDPRSLPPGIKQTSNVLTRTDSAEQKLQVNLLGILNFLSVGTIARVSTIEKNANGDITLVTDTSDASRLEALLLNAGGDAKRLRRLLSEDFLIQAAYQVSGPGVLPPSFSSNHTFFEIRDQTNSQNMQEALDVARALGLLSQQDETARLQKANNFGRTTFYAATKYSSDQVRPAFLDAGGNPRPVEAYETLARTALGVLLSGSTGQDFRKRVADTGAAGNALWQKMKSIGNVQQFGPLFGISLSEADPRVAAVGSDYIVITSWAAAMHEAGKVMKEVEGILANPGVQIGDTKLTQARDHLKKRLADVVSHSQEHFGAPLGLLTVYFAAGKSATTRVIMTGAQIERLDASHPAAISS